MKKSIKKIWAILEVVNTVLRLLSEWFKGQPAGDSGSNPKEALKGAGDGQTE